MRKWLFVLGIAIVGGTFVATEVDARRLGGGRSIGAQRNVTTPPQQTPAKPAQQQSAQGQQQGAQQAAPAQSGSRWLPILGGLALGGILGYMLGGGGVMGALLGIALLAGIVMLAALAFRAFAMRRQEHRVQYAGIRESVSVPVRTQLPASGQTTRVPAEFDAAGFLRAAKMNFLKLQTASDAGRLEEIREFTTDELYEELKRDLGGNQQTDIVALEADLLDVVQEGDRHWASVRFTGTVTEAPGATPEAFAEVWNLVKPADGSSGWLLAGIQQMH